MTQVSYHNQSNIDGRRSGKDRRVNDDSYYCGIERRISGNRRKKTRERESKRFRSNDHTFVRLRSESNIDVSQVTDISKAGLAFRYLLDLRKSQDYLDLDIVDYENDFNINSIPFQVIHQSNYIASPLSAAVTKRCGVKFNELTSEQNDKLDYYLQNHTSGMIH